MLPKKSRTERPKVAVRESRCLKRFLNATKNSMFRIRVCRSLDGRRCPAVWFRGEVVQQAGRGLEEKEDVLHCGALNGTSWWVQGPGQIGKEEEAMGDREDGAFGVRVGKAP